MIAKVTLFVFVVIACCYANKAVDLTKKLVNDESRIKLINSNPKSSWTAGHNKNFDGKTLADASILMGFIPNAEMKSKFPVVTTTVKDIPATFDATVQWPTCTTIGTIYNQADCGSCWAFGCVEAVSDRFCIQQGVADNQILSFMEETACAPCEGCQGGDPYSAWSYVAEAGLVTADCYPYDIPTCPPQQQPCLNFVNTPSCLSTCNATNEKWVPYQINTPYGVNASVEAIQTEILNNGPVEACFTVYSDFLNYKSGVYQYQNGSALGGHCVKMIGWGVEDNLPYWLINNSWTTYWGDNGQFKILRGQDECGIEDDIVAGMTNSL